MAQRKSLDLEIKMLEAPLPREHFWHVTSSQRAHGYGPKHLPKSTWQKNTALLEPPLELRCREGGCPCGAKFQHEHVKRTLDLGPSKVQKNILLERTTEIYANSAQILYSNIQIGTCGSNVQ